MGFVFISSMAVGDFPYLIEENLLKDFTLHHSNSQTWEINTDSVNSLCTGDHSAHGQARDLCALTFECSSHQMQEKGRKVESMTSLSGQGSP